MNENKELKGRRRYDEKDVYSGEFEHLEGENRSAAAGAEQKERKSLKKELRAADAVRNRKTLELNLHENTNMQGPVR